MITPPTGWELVLRTDDGTAAALAVYRRRNTREVGDEHAFALSQAASFVAALVLYAGADHATPVDAAAGQTNAASTNCAAPSVTTTRSSARLLHLAAGETGAVTSTPPVGFTERFDRTGGALALALSDAVWAAAGATGTRSATLSAAVASIGQLIALAPSRLNNPDAIRDEGNWKHQGWSNRFTSEAEMDTFVDDLAQAQNAALRERLGAALYTERVLTDPWNALLARAEMHLSQAALLDAAAQIAESGDDTNPAPFLGTGAQLRSLADRRRRLAEEIIASSRTTNRPGPGSPLFRSSPGAGPLRSRFDPEEGLSDA